MTTTCHDISPRLSEYVDGTLADGERAAIAAHLATCAACAGLARDLGRLRDTARQLGPVAPPAHLALEIAGRIRLEATSATGPGAADGGSPPAEPVARPADRRHAAWQWLGLAAALLLVTAGAYYLSGRGTPPPAPSTTTAAGNPGAAASVETIAQELDQAAAIYEKAIGQLETLTKNGTSGLDPTLAMTMQKNVTVLDGAISQSRAALKDNPENEAARDSLFEALRRKVSILQDTVVLINEMRKGNQAGAARILGGRSL
jgi:anti-sigma factor RsiW